MSDRQGVSRSGLLKLGLAIVVVATVLGLGITQLLPTSHHTKRAPVTSTTEPCAREQASVQFAEGVIAHSGPAPVNGSIPLGPPTVGEQLLARAQAALNACVAALHK
jgi:hypothetical protein